MPKRESLQILPYFIFTMTCLLAPNIVFAQSESCVTSQCHSTMGSAKSVHAPVKERICTSCHQATPKQAGAQDIHPGNITITLIQQGAELCYNCHEPKNDKKVVHAPIQGGDCTGCHDPHQSSNKGMLKDAMPALCFQCHPEKGLKQASKHRPIESGSCGGCHDNHQSDFTGRLVKENNELCYACHRDKGEGLKTQKSVHPAAIQSCVSCHNPHGSATKPLLNSGVPQICYTCHEAKGSKKVVHAPVQGGDCSSCHNPHYSQNKGMLKEASPALCFQCHPDSIMKFPSMHPPVAAGDCSGCHDNHQSDFRGHLMQDGNTLCFTCHPGKEEDLKSKKSLHPPVADSCVSCHHPHGSANNAMLSSPVPDLCSNCHTEQTGLTSRAIVKHGPMSDARSCMNCHEAHSAEAARLLQKQQLDLCAGCHNKEMETGQGKIANMKALFENAKNQHGPVKSGDCSSCHNAHGTDYWRLLVKYYPPDFYASYSDGQYGICFTCHSKEAFADYRTTKATRFRDGNKNLHFVHVNKAPKGRTCRACHEVHADNGRPSHVREYMPFSDWSMPMNFIQDKNGGSCAPGCHGEKRYSR